MFGISHETSLGSSPWCHDAHDSFILQTANYPAELHHLDKNVLTLMPFHLEVSLFTSLKLFTYATAFHILACFVYHLSNLSTSIKTIHRVKEKLWDRKHFVTIVILYSWNHFWENTSQKIKYKFKTQLFRNRWEILVLGVHKTHPTFY